MHSLPPTVSRDDAAANGPHAASGSSVRGPPSERSTYRTGVKRGAARARVVAAVRSPAAVMFIVGAVLVGQAVIDQLLPQGHSTGGTTFNRRELQDAGSGDHDHGGDAGGSSNSPSPSPPPPAPPPSPPPDPPRLVVVRIVAAGTPDDFGTAEKDAIILLFATKAQVRLDAVTVTIIAASVQITVTIAAADAAAAAAVTTALEDVLADSDAATTFMQQAVPEIVVESTNMQTQIAPSDASIDPAIIGGAAAGGGVFVLLVVLAGVAFACRKRKTPSQPVTAPVATVDLQQVQATIPSQNSHTEQPSAIPSGPRFDPYTGVAIPKFDPQTGRQNWQ